MKLFNLNTTRNGCGLIAVACLLLSGCSGDARPLEEAVEAVDLDLIELSISAPPNSLDPLYVNTGTQIQYQLVGKNSSGASVAVSNVNRRWTISDSNAASISSDGLLTALAESAVPVTVGVRVAGLFAENQLNIANGELVAITNIEGKDAVRRCEPASFYATGMFSDASSSTRTVQSASWTIEPSDTVVARLGTTVNGVVSLVGINPGAAVLTANVGNITFSKTIEVGTELESIEISPVEPVVSVNGNTDLVAVGNYTAPADALSADISQSVDWQILEGSEFVSVQNVGDEKGQLTGIDEGSATVQAACGVTMASATVTIVASTSGLSFDQDSPFLIRLGGTERELNVSTGDSYDQDQDRTEQSEWSVTSGNEYLRVNNDGSDKGKLEPLAVGRATVQAEYDGNTVSINVDVVE